MKKIIHYTTNDMNKVEELLEEILQEICDRRDEGKAMYLNGTLSTTVFTIIDLIGGAVTTITDPLLTTTTSIGGVPGHPVKGYSVKNTDSTNNIFLAHNIAEQTQLDVDLVDTLKTNTPIFTTLGPKEVESTNYNVNCIRNVYLLAVSGTPTFKIKLVW